MRGSLKNKTLQDGLTVLLLALALGVCSLIGFFTARVQSAWYLSPWLFPLLLALLSLPLSAALIREGRRELRGAASGEAPAVSGLGKPAAVVLLAAAYLALMGLIRFIPATALFLAALIRLLGERRWWMVAALTVLTPLVLYAVFAIGLSVRLP